MFPTLQTATSPRYNLSETPTPYLLDPLSTYGASASSKYDITTGSFPTRHGIRPCHDSLCQLRKRCTAPESVGFRRSQVCLQQMGRPSLASSHSGMICSTICLNFSGLVISSPASKYSGVWRACGPASLFCLKGRNLQKCAIPIIFVTQHLTHPFS
jgi:hypothetical protein